MFGIGACDRWIAKFGKNGKNATRSSSATWSNGSAGSWNQEGNPFSDPDHLREGLTKVEEKLNKVHHSLAMVIQEQEALLNRWRADSTVKLGQLVDQQFQKIREREEARQQDRENRKRSR